MLCYVMSCHVMSCHVMSCHVMSCHVTSRHVTSCHVMSCHVMLFLVSMVLFFRRTGNANDIISKQQIVIAFIPAASMFGIIILSRTVRVRDTRRLSLYNLRLENNKMQILDKVLKLHKISWLKCRQEIFTKSFII